MIIVELDVMMARRRMTVGKLAAAVGLNPANIAVLRNGRARAVRFSTLDALCRALDCQPGDLLRSVPDDTRPALRPPVYRGTPRGPRGHGATDGATGSASTPETPSAATADAEERPTRAEYFQAAYDRDFHRDQAIEELDFWSAMKPDLSEAEVRAYLIDKWTQHT